MAFLYSDTITASFIDREKDFAFGSLRFGIFKKTLTGNCSVAITTVTERLLRFGSEFMTGDTKERILETALELFAQSGYLGTSMSDISEAYTAKRV